MLSFLAPHPPRTPVCHLTRLTFDDGKSWIEFKDPSDRFLVRNHWPPAPHGTTIWGETSTPFWPQCSLHPPLHWHRFQSETFRVLKGSAAFSIDGQTVLVEADGEVVVPKAAVHSFCNASREQEMDIEFVLEPHFRRRDEAYFRNIQTCRDDYRRVGRALPFPQALLFMRAADIVPVLPGPRWISKPLGLVVQYLIGVVWGKWILGFKERYPEYSSDYDGSLD